MLVLSRRKEESIIIDGNIRLIVTEIAGSSVKIGIDAPADVGIVRAELIQPPLGRARDGNRSRAAVPASSNGTGSNRTRTGQSGATGESPHSE